MSSSPTSSARTATEVVMPKIGVSISEGTVIEWLVGAGEQVEADQTVCEVSTDKTDVEIPAPCAGTVERILVEVGETVAVGTPLAEIGERDEASPEPRPRPKPHDGNGAGATPSAANGEIDRSGFYSPVVRRIASEEGVDLARVRGHGVGGRIRKQDLLDFLRSREDEGAAPSLHSDSPYRPEPERAAPDRAASDAADRTIPLDGMRGAIARHMVHSRRTAAHCTTVVEADFSGVVADRERRRAGDRDSAPTYLAYVARATVGALRAHPLLNATVADEEIHLHEEVNLGIAVAVEEGLVVPVIHRAERLSLDGLAAAIADLAERARAGKLAAGETEGGTFTITNPGRHGAILATPIINQPQVAILDLEAVVERPVAIPSAGGAAIAVRPISYLCMSWDHRALDGIAAARFLGTVRERLESGCSE